MTIEEYKKFECDFCGKTQFFEKDEKGIVWILENGEKAEPWEIEKSVTIKYHVDMFGPAELGSETMDICPECYKKMLEFWPITYSQVGEKSKYSFTKEERIGGRTMTADEMFKEAG